MEQVSEIIVQPFTVIFFTHHYTGTTASLPNHKLHWHHYLYIFIFEGGVDGDIFSFLSLDDVNAMPNKFGPISLKHSAIT